MDSMLDAVLSVNQRKSFRKKDHLYRGVKPWKRVISAQEGISVRTILT